MGKIAFVFAGQGAQYPGMGQSVYQASAAAKALLDDAEQLRGGTLEQCFAADKENLSQTINAQPCPDGCGLRLRSRADGGGRYPDGLVGFSLVKLRLWV